MSRLSLVIRTSSETFPVGALLSHLDDVQTTDCDTTVICGTEHARFASQSLRNALLSSARNAEPGSFIVFYEAQGSRPPEAVARLMRQLSAKKTEQNVAKSFDFAGQWAATDVKNPVLRTCFCLSAVAVPPTANLDYKPTSG